MQDQNNNKISMNFFLEPYKGIVSKQEKERIIREQKKEEKERKVRAYLLRTVKIPEFYFLTFVTYREAYEKAQQLSRHILEHGYERIALYNCNKYIGEATGVRNTSNGIYFSLRYRHVKRMDKYYSEGIVPIYEFLLEGVKFRCKHCGVGSFGLEDYENKECKIVEGEGDYNEFTKGIVLCRECYNKVFTYEP